MGTVSGPVSQWTGQWISRSVDRPVSGPVSVPVPTPAAPSPPLRRHWSRPLGSLGSRLVTRLAFGHSAHLRVGHPPSAGAPHRRQRPRGHPRQLVAVQVARLRHSIVTPRALRDPRRADEIIAPFVYLAHEAEVGEPRPGERGTGAVGEGGGGGGGGGKLHQRRHQALVQRALLREQARVTLSSRCAPCRTRRRDNIITPRPPARTGAHYTFITLRTLSDSQA
eukprot:2821418-Pyramimonas_sp.AAC.2